MGRVTYNQSGYVGSSMSVGARDAYDDGEMPKSKWTKKAMISAIREFCDDNDLFYDSDIEKLTKGELWHRFIKWSSWHHTGKYANETDFYSLDEDELLNAFRPMTEAELQQKEAERQSGETGNSLKDAAKEMQAAARPRDAFAGKNDDARRIQNRRDER